MATYAKKRSNLSKRARLASSKLNTPSIFDEIDDNKSETLLDIFPDIDVPKDPTISKVKKQTLEKKPKVTLPKNKNTYVSKKQDSKSKKPKSKQPPSKKKVDLWGDLLNNIDAIPIELPKVSLDVDLENDEDGDGSTEPSSELPLNIDLNFDYLPDESVSTQQEQQQQPITILQKLTTSQTKTYSQDRSYLIEDQIIDVKQELGERISHTHDFRNDDHNDNDDVINVNDLRKAGKLNQFQDIIDGLASSLTNLQLSSLLELLDNEHARDLLSYVIKLINCEKEIIRYVSSIVVSQTFGRDPSLMSKYMNKLHVVWLGLKLTILSGQVAKIYRDIIQRLIHDKHDVEFLQLLIDQQTISKRICLLQLDDVTSELGLELILKFLDTAEEEFNENDLIKFKPKLNSCFNNIKSRKYAQTDLKLMKILAILTTTSSQNLVSSILDDDWIPILISHMTPPTTNTESLEITLCVLAVLLNFVDWGLLSRHIDLINQQIPKLEEIERDDESKQYIIGYNSIILSHLKLNHKSNLSISNDDLISNLIEFKARLESSNKGLYSMVCNLINKL